MNALETEKWVARYADYLFGIALLKTNDAPTAQDLVQDTFLSALRAQETFQGLSSEKTWLTTILNNKIIDFYRKQSTAKKSIDFITSTQSLFEREFFETETGKAGHWLRHTAPRNWNADHEVEESEFFKILEGCIGKLPRALVPAFVARYLNEKDSEEICKELELTASNYWAIVHRAKVLMRACLEKNWFLKS
ncbi:MAG: sigma-70 family RNA polymerase sigma factor [Cyclobacteriaceae bacterium]|nr:sigma-70 family RNA polymerase sigma factor [Cyclobacteriaceae bacterium]